MSETIDERIMMSADKAPAAAVLEAIEKNFPGTRCQVVATGIYQLMGWENEQGYQYRSAAILVEGMTLEMVKWLDSTDPYTIWDEPNDDEWPKNHYILVTGQAELAAGSEDIVEVRLSSYEEIKDEISANVKAVQAGANALESKHQKTLNEWKVIQKEKEDTV